MSSIFGKADLHIHTQFSCDCFTPLRTIFEMAEKRGLDIIAITDHNTLKGAREAEKIAPEYKVKLVKGEEIDTKQGQLIGLFLTESIKAGGEILETIKEIRQQNGLVIIPHPLNILQKGVSWRTLFKIFPEADGIEIFNGAQTWLVNPLRKKILRANYEKFNLSMIGVSDAHIKEQVGMGYTLFAGKTPEDLYQAIKNRTTKSKKISNFLEILKISCKIVPTQPLRSIKWLFKHHASL